jgi:iron complex outermembrane receptor protein
MRSHAAHASLVSLIAVAAVALANAPANAQAVDPQPASADQQPPAAPETGGEIIVTAQKRAERLQDVPLAVTAITAAGLANRQINDTSNLVQAVPSLSFQQGNNPTNTTFRVRGIGTALFSQGVESSVSVVVDGVVAARQAQNFTDFADIERVEILRGPQGTLFGKNATAGVISVVTARPSSKFEGLANVTVAEGDEYRAGGTISGPISDALRARVTGYYNNVGGFQKNVATGGHDGGFESWGVRGKLEWDATERLNLLLMADYRKSEADCCQQVLVQANNPLRPQVNGGARIAPDTRQVWNNDATFANSTQKTVSLTAGLDLDWANLTSITAYQDFKLVNNFEADRLGSAVPIFITVPASALFDFNQGLVRPKQFSEELRLDSSGGGPLTWTVGGYYSHLTLGRDFARRRATCTTGTFGQPCLAANVRYASLGSTAELKNEHIAGFGQAELAVAGGLKLLGGIRVQHESISVAGRQTGVLVTGDTPFGALFPAGKVHASDSVVTGKFGGKYEFSRRAQIYATYTRGYKGIGLDTELTTNFATNPVIEPERVNAYEVGFKGSTADGVLSVAAAMFLSKYVNLQVQANRSDTLTGAVAFQTTNAGRSETMGVEFEATLRPTDQLSIAASITYQKPTLDVDGLNCPTQFQAGAQTVALGGARPVNSCYRFQYALPSGALAVSGPVQDIRGGSLPASPHVRISLSPRYEADLGGNVASFFQIDVSYQSRQQFAIEQDPFQIQRDYALVDASVGLKDVDNRYSLTFFVKNLFNKNFYTTTSTAALISTNTNVVDVYAFRPKNADRYFGATLGTKF